MILQAFLLALQQLPDRRFRRVIWQGLGLAIALLVAAYWLFLALLGLVTPETFALPLIGVVSLPGGMLSLASLLIILLLSVFLMVPVASAFCGLFLDRVAEAVEDRHYPGLPKAQGLPLGQSLIDSANFLGVILVINTLALGLYPFAGPLSPLLFWAINGYLLGREYFQIAALRRLSRPQARALRRQHALRIWLAGILMAAPLSLPLVNLVIPVLGAATFTHLFHRLAALPRD